MRINEITKMGCRRRSEYITLISDLGELGALVPDFKLGASRTVANMLLNGQLVAARAYIEKNYSDATSSSGSGATPNSAPVRQSGTFTIEDEEE